MEGSIPPNPPGPGAIPPAGEPAPPAPPPSSGHGAPPPPGYGASPPPPPPNFGAPPPYPGPPPGGGWYGAPPPPALPPLPIEDPARSPFEGFFATIGLFFTRPTEAYRRMSLSAPMVRPIVYSVIVGWIGMIATFFYQSFFNTLMSRLLPEDFSRREILSKMVISGATVFMGPLLIPIGILIGALITHLMLVLLGGARRGFGATFRVGAYSNTSVLLELIPGIGGLLGGIWLMVLQIIGLSEAHGISRGRAAAAVLLPTLLCCCLCAVGVFFFSAAIMGALSSLTGN